MPGPAPDPNALRRDRPSDIAGWTTLPATPRTEPAPSWPLPDVNDRELEVWSSLWRKPQAALWLLNGQEREVAIFVRRSIEAEERESPVTLGGLVQKLADALLLTIPSMYKARVKIAGDDLGKKRTAKAAAADVRPSARDRLKALSAGGA